MLNKTSTGFAPWYVIPADNKWFARTSFCDILVSHLEGLDLHYPEVNKKQLAQLNEAKSSLIKEA